eukprot:357435-Chlamydomonas_euryale.AAC.8
MASCVRQGRELLAVPTAHALEMAGNHSMQENRRMVETSAALSVVRLCRLAEYWLLACLPHRNVRVSLCGQICNAMSAMCCFDLSGAVLAMVKSVHVPSPVHLCFCRRCAAAGGAQDDRMEGSAVGSGGGWLVAAPCLPPAYPIGSTPCNSDCLFCHCAPLPCNMPCMCAWGQTVGARQHGRHAAGPHPCVASNATALQLSWCCWVVFRSRASTTAEILSGAPAIRPALLVGGNKRVRYERSSIYCAAPTPAAQHVRGVCVGGGLGHKAQFGGRLSCSSATQPNVTE